MKFLVRGLLGIVALVLAFAIVSYVLFGDDPAGRLTLELDHSMQVGATELRTVSVIEGCTLSLTVSQIEAVETVGDAQRLDIPIKDLAKATHEAGPGYIEFVMPTGTFAQCTDIPGGPCATAQRTELQLNMPKIQTDDQAARVLEWISELAESCEGA